MHLLRMKSVLLMILYLIMCFKINSFSFCSGVQTYFAANGNTKIQTSLHGEYNVHVQCTLYAYNNCPFCNVTMRFQWIFRKFVHFFLFFLNCYFRNAVTKHYVKMNGYKTFCYIIHILFTFNFHIFHRHKQF